MPSPFPGIDPYLESQHYWPDFHASFNIYLRDALAAILPDQYMVRIEERIYLVEHESDDLRLVRPDLLIDTPERRPDRPGGGVALDIETTTIPLAILEEVRATYIEIIHRPDRSLVAVLELLSPDNKVEPGYGQYLGKRNALIRGPAHLIELDFLVGGRRLPMGLPLPPGDFYALVARGDHRPNCEVYAWSIRRPLTAIRLPLIAPDPDLRLELAPVYATAFERGRYARSIDYAAPLALPLAPEDRAWAEERAKAAAR